MVKMFLISSLVMSIEFFNDTVSCIVAEQDSMSKEFVHSACWIQGFYIYHELRFRIGETSYYGKCNIAIIKTFLEFSFGSLL